MVSEDTKTTEPTMTDSTNITNGRVKWFNNKAGYGFITSSTGEDVFVHHSAIKVSQEQYRYLVQGEYVEFTQNSLSNSKHKYQAGSVKGISNGKLMCETRQESRDSRQTYKKQDDGDSPGDFTKVNRFKGRKPGSPRKDVARQRPVKSSPEEA